MSRATPQTRELAARLIALETKKTSSTGADTPTAFHVCEKLRPQLATLMGNGGFRAVLSRAVVVAGAEAPWLATVQVREDGSLDGGDKVKSPKDEKDMAEGGVLLVAQLIGLLVAFIGENLTLRLVRDVWPRLKPEDFSFTQEDHEEA